MRKRSFPRARKQISQLENTRHFFPTTRRASAAFFPFVLYPRTLIKFEKRRPAFDSSDTLVGASRISLIRFFSIVLHTQCNDDDTRREENEGFTFCARAKKTYSTESAFSHHTVDYVIRSGTMTDGWPPVGGRQY